MLEFFRKLHFGNVKNKEYGFTLIELLVVILVIGIISSIATPVVLNQRKAANETSVKNDLTNAAKVFETEFVSNKGKNYPVTMPASVKISDGVKISLPSETVLKPIVQVTATDVSGYSVQIDFRETPTGVSHNRFIENMDKLRLFRWKTTWSCSNGSSIEELSSLSAFYVYARSGEQQLPQDLACNTPGYTRIPGSVVISSPPPNTDALSAQGMTSIPDSTGKVAPKPSNKGFCINGTHENIGGKMFKYDSLSGGFQEGSC